MLLSGREKLESTVQESDMLTQTRHHRWDAAILGKDAARKQMLPSTCHTGTERARQSKRERERELPCLPSLCSALSPPSWMLLSSSLALQQSNNRLLISFNTFACRDKPKPLFSTTSMNSYILEVLYAKGEIFLVPSHKEEHEGNH